MAKIEYGHTFEEYMQVYGNAYDNGSLWDFSKEDFENGAVEIDDNQVYWIVGDRYYETKENN